MSEIFSRPLQNLEKIRKTLAANNALIKNGMQKGAIDLDKSIQKINQTANTTLKTFNKIYGVIKNITLASMVSGFGLGARGWVAQKSVVEAKDLGLSSKESSALEFAGKQSGRGGDFFKDMLKEIKGSILDYQDWGAFANIGLDANKLKDMSSLEILNEVMENAKNFKGDAKLLNDSIQKIAGVNFYQLQNLDLEKFNQDLQEGLTYYDNSNNKIKTMGEGFNRVVASLEGVVNKIVSQLSPAVSKVFDNIARGIATISNNKNFQKMLDDFGKFLSSGTQDFGKVIDKLLVDIPQILRNIQLFFLRMLESLSYMVGVVTFGETSKKAYSMSKWAETKADDLVLKDFATQETPKTFKNAKELQDYHSGMVEVGEILHKRGGMDKQELDALKQLNIKVEIDDKTTKVDTSINGMQDMINNRASILKNRG